MYHICNVYCICCIMHVSTTEVKDTSPLVKQPRQIPKRVGTKEDAEVITEEMFGEIYANQAKLRKEVDEVGMVISRSVNIYI